MEGIDVEPAAGVAIASLARAVRDGAIARDETVLLNVTGGGRALRARVTHAQQPASIVTARGDRERRRARRLTSGGASARGRDSLPTSHGARAAANARDGAHRRTSSGSVFPSVQCSESSRVKRPLASISYAG